MTLEEKLAAAEAEIAALKSKEKPVSFKVSEKKALSVYGLGRFPVTLYMGQWEKLLNHVDDLKQFIKDNETLLAVKE